MTNNTTGFSFTPISTQVSAQDALVRNRIRERDTSSDFASDTQSFQRTYESIDQANNKPRARAPEPKRVAEPKRDSARIDDTRADKKADELKSSSDKNTKAEEQKNLDQAKTAKDSTVDDKNSSAKEATPKPLSSEEDTQETKSTQAEQSSTDLEDPVLSEPLNHSLVQPDGAKKSVTQLGGKSDTELTLDKDTSGLNTELKQPELLEKNSEGKHTGDIKLGKLASKNKTDSTSKSEPTDLLLSKTTSDQTPTENPLVVAEATTAIPQPAVLDTGDSPIVNQAVISAETKQGLSQGEAEESSSALDLNSNLLADTKIQAAQNSHAGSAHGMTKANGFENAFMSENKNQMLDAKFSAQDTSLPKEIQTQVASSQTDFTKMNQQFFDSPQLMLNEVSQASARSFSVKTSVDLPVGQPQWSQAVGDKVLWLAAQNVSSAELQLHPQDLGPLHVKISIGQDQVTTVNFTSHHAQVREVLDQNIQRLKDMLAEQGMNSVNVDVSDRSFKGDSQKFGSSQGGNQHKQSVIEDEPQLVAVTSVQNLRLVDHYA